jgi:hypothetical protein
MTPVTTTTLSYNVSCPLLKIRTVVTYPGTLGSYYRTLVLPENLSNTSTFKIFLIDYNTTTAVLSTFQLLDIVQQYQDAEIIVTRNLNGTEETILSDFADIEGKVNAYLIQSQQYTVKLKSSNFAERIFGNFNADTSGFKIIRLNDVNLAPSDLPSLVGVQYINNLINESGVVKIILSYNDTNDVQVVANGTFYVLNKTNNVLLSSSSSTARSALFTYNTAPNNDYIAGINVTPIAGVTAPGMPDPVIKTFTTWLSGADIKAALKFDNPDTLNWIIFLVGCTLALAFTAMTAYIGTIIVAAFLFLTSMPIGPQQVSWIDYPAAAHPMIIATFFGLIALMQFIMTRLKTLPPERRE